MDKVVAKVIGPYERKTMTVQEMDTDGNVLATSTQYVPRPCRPGLGMDRRRCSVRFVPVLRYASDRRSAEAMSNMIDFTVALLGAVADFLSAEPVFYLFTVIILCFICKAVIILCSH